MAPWTFSVKFPYDTQFTFRSLMFAAREDGNLELLIQGPALKQLALVYGHDPYLLVSSSKLGGACSDLNPYAGPYHCATKTTRGIPIGAPIFQPSTRTSSTYSSTTSPNQDSTDDYPEIGGSTYCISVDGGCLILRVASARAPSHNSSNRYSIIGRSEASNAWTSNDAMIQNLNLDFNVVRLQTIMESSQRMAPKGYPLVALAQQGAEAANYVIAEWSVVNPRREPSISNLSNDRVRWAWSEAVSSTSGNHHLANNDHHLWRSLRIGGVSEHGDQLLYDDLQQEMLSHQGGAVFVLWLHR
jgi:hypothetical protein